MDSTKLKHESHILMTVDKFLLGYKLSDHIEAVNSLIFHFLEQREDIPDDYLLNTIYKAQLITVFLAQIKEDYEKMKKADELKVNSRRK